ncbi:TSC22 domain family protein 1 [Dicentrarchus labrax]|uniref:TSC22 domain family protein 1 n=1 Tax=Dicentrarchus labrax TaxID=13489 RepID=UPI0021F53D45|nr:TSC22 domain family protein 1 [Dicentrarchus labrax]XP_051251805.1 TSC22 domain family protein 1 [Dicentrarchus labrax]XP_051251806.1 TSC22 domain family protein 1 [Dicentrarchus labrax]
MSGGKKRSGFQITSVTSDFNQTPAAQSAPSVVLNVLQSAVSSSTLQGSSSQPTTPSLKRKYISHDASGQGGCSSRFRVVRLVVGGVGGGGRGEPYRRGRWTCMDFMERQEGVGFRRVMDTMRHAHSLESLEMIGCDIDRGGVHSQDTAHLLAHPLRGREGAGLVLRSGPPSPTHQEPINIRLLDCKEPIGVHGFDSKPPPPSPRPRNVPPPLRLDVDAAGRSVLRLSHSQPSSPPAGPYHPILTPIQTPAAFSLDQTIFNLPGEASSSSNSLIAIDNKIEQAMDLVKSHLMLAVREEVELLKEQIRELQERNQQLERENHILRTLTHNIHTA